VTFFVDWCLGSHFVPDALADAGEHVIRHRDTDLASDADDEAWVALTAANGWIAVTKDLGKGRPLPLEEIHAHRARVFALRSGNLKGAEMAAAFLRALPRMKRLAEKGGPFVARVYKNGTVSLWRAGDQLLEA